MSVWASVGCGTDDVTIYDAEYGDTTPEDGFLDVAVSCISDRVRIIAESEGDSGLSLDADGVRDLIARLQAALINMETRR